MTLIELRRNSLVNLAQEKEHNMCYEAKTEDNTLRYTLNRLRDIYYSHERTIYGKYEPLDPESKEEAEKWLKEKNYHFKTISENNYSYPFGWGKEPIDYQAKEKDRENLNNAYQTAKDTISIISDEDRRLKALKEFESFTIH